MKLYVKPSYDFQSMEEIILQILAKEEYEFYGLRVDYNNYSVGDTCEPSHQWWQDDPEDDSPYIEDFGFWDGGELDGTCAIEIIYYINNGNEIIKSLRNAINLACNVYANMYGGGYDILLLGSDDAQGGNDTNEIIMKDAVVLYKF